MILYLLNDDLPWWRHLVALAEGTLGSPDSTPAPDATPGRPEPPASARAELLRAWVEGGHEDAWTAVADALVHGASPAWALAARAPGVARTLLHDVSLVLDVARRAVVRDERRPVPPLGPEGAEPPLQGLAPRADGFVAALAERLRRGADAAEAVDEVLRFRKRRGGGPLGRYRAFRWDGRTLHGIAGRVTADARRLQGLDRPLASLEANTLAFLNGDPAMHVLLYGPRGSGKSTAVRGLLPRHASRGLRLVELPPHALGDLPEVLARLAGRPERFLLFVDDLSFEAGDARYHPLKTLLEGSVAERPENVRLYATSNRRHLVQERLRERPDPLDDDVHAWDTQHERLALADRFGLLLTFPRSDRNHYLEIVRHLAVRDGLATAEADERTGGVEELERRADRFAREGNGYSGRTAQQFVDAARAGLA